MRRILLLALACSTVAGCQRSAQPRVSFADTNRAPHATPVRNPDAVEIFATRVPGDDYTEIGIIEAKHAAPDATAALASLRRVAACRGCDAVILQGRQSHIAGATTTGQVNRSQLTGDATVTSQTMVMAENGYVGVCIVYAEPRPPSAPPVEDPCAAPAAATKDEPVLNWWTGKQAARAEPSSPW